MMGADEKFVRAHWEWVDVREAQPYEGVKQGKWVARLPLLPFSQIGFENAEEAWKAAAEFTRERLEGVRQLREEIGQMGDLRDMKYIDILNATETNGVGDLIDDNDWIVTIVRDLCEYCRTLKRLETILAELKRGMIA